MKIKWAVLIPFIIMIIAITPNTTYATESQSKLEEKAKDFISDIPAGVKIIGDIAYRKGQSKAWRLDMAMPKEPSDEPRPAIVFIHGGGWRSGDKRRDNFLGPTLEFATKGYVCITINYRLTDEAPMPACIEDVKCAVRWLRAHAKEYNVDPNRIGAYGNSAGAHLAAMLGLCPASAGLEGDGPWQEYSSMVQAVVCSATPTNFPLRGPDAEEKTDSAKIKNFMSTLFAGLKETLQQRMRQASPITYVTADAPPFLIIHGTADKTVPVSQSDELVKALQQAGAKDVTYMRIDGAGHGVFEQNIEKTGPAREAFFERTLKKKAEPLAKTANVTNKATTGKLPTYKDVKYGPHERNVLDFYQAESDKPTPLAVYIHGGGFRGGNKKSLNADTLQELLDAGISVAAVEYRLISDKPLPAAHQDSLRALQFIRSKAKDWNIDKSRVGAFGGSAGAQICMWLAFHDEMAQPSSGDPVQRESSRLTCMATAGGQTILDFDWWMRWIPGYESPHRERTEMFGDITDEELHKVIKDISALSLITADDPPIFMSYAMKPDDAVPSDPKKAQGWKVHHVIFGIKLKEKMDELGVEADLKYPGARTTYRSNADFFIAKLSRRGG